MRCRYGPCSVWRIAQKLLVAEALARPQTPRPDGKVFCQYSHAGNRRERKRAPETQKNRILKQHKEGYIEDEAFEGEMTTITLALKTLDVPEVRGSHLRRGDRSR